jgi:hypothetical protein
MVTKVSPIGSSEISVPIYQSTRRFISEESNIHGQRFEHVPSRKHSELLKTSLARTRQDARVTSGMLHVMIPSRLKRFMIRFMIVLCIKTRNEFKIPSCWFWALLWTCASKTHSAIFINLYVTIALFGTFYLVNSSSFSFRL